MGHGYLTKLISVGKVTKFKPRVDNIKMGLTISGQSVINPIKKRRTLKRRRKGNKITIEVVV